MLAGSEGVGATVTGGGVWLETAGSRGGHGAGGDTEWITITQRDRANQRGLEIIFLIFTARAIGRSDSEQQLTKKCDLQFTHAYFATHQILRLLRVLRVKT